jgi:predicted CopG family antitoxin
MYKAIVVARQISVSDELYEKLSKIKGKRSFTGVITDAIETGKKKDIMEFFGILKSEGKKLDQLQKLITKERENNYGRNVEW